MLSPSYDEVTTIARDGCVRAWYWDTVDQADPPEEDPYIELNPVAETCVRIDIYCILLASIYYYLQKKMEFKKTPSRIDICCYPQNLLLTKKDKITAFTMLKLL